MTCPQIKVNEPKGLQIKKKIKKHSVPGNALSFSPGTNRDFVPERKEVITRVEKSDQE